MRKESGGGGGGGGGEGGGVRSDRRLRPIYGTVFLLFLLVLRSPPPFFSLYLV